MKDEIRNNLLTSILLKNKIIGNTTDAISNALKTPLKIKIRGHKLKASKRNKTILSL